MRRTLLRLVLCSAAYGWSIGSVHSLKFAARNLVKFPALLLLTAAVCGLGYQIVGRALSSELGFREIQRLSLQLFSDVAVLLGSLSPAVLFLAYSIVPPDGVSLQEYPLFLGLNVVAIAACGTVALVRQSGELVRRHSLSRFRSLTLITAWLALTLFVGGQAAWTLRPFCGVASIDAPFFLGAAPDFRGDTDFYQAVYHLVDPPPLRPGYASERGRIRR